MATFQHHEHNFNTRVFKWAAKLFIEKQDRPAEPADGLILMRASTAAASEVIAVPFDMQEMHDVTDTNFLVILVATMKHLAILGSYKNLDWLAYDLIYCELALKFGRCEKLWKKDPDNALVMFFDLKVNQSARSDQAWCEENDDNVKEELAGKKACINPLNINAEIMNNLENVEEIEDCLKVCPGMVVKETRRMEEVKAGSMEVVVFNEETEPDCPIFLRKIRTGYRFALTPCSHRFHKTCLRKWLHKGKKSCPLCRFVVDSCRRRHNRHRNLTSASQSDRRHRNLWRAMDATSTDDIPGLNHWHPLPRTRLPYITSDADDEYYIHPFPFH